MILHAGLVEFPHDEVTGFWRHHFDPHQLPNQPPVTLKDPYHRFQPSQLFRSLLVSQVALAALTAPNSESPRRLFSNEKALLGGTVLPPSTIPIFPCPLTNSNVWPARYLSHHCWGLNVDCIAALCHKQVA